MPLTTNYTPIINLISLDRIGSYRSLFRHSSDAELYGIYIWSQYAAGAIYPLIQNLEVTLRNSIDSAARSKFGDMWWDSIQFSGKKTAQPQCKFFNKIDDAKTKLTIAWEKKEKARLRLKSRQKLPATSICPTWTHDQIVAATDFSAWEFILLDSFSTNKPNLRSQYLWPQLLGKAFLNFHLISSSSDVARKDLQKLIYELREYRNRIFHHEPLWIKAPTVTDETTAINTIRNKINKIEKLLEVIDKRKLEILTKTGMFRSVRRVCSVEELEIYAYRSSNFVGTVKQKRIIRKLLAITSKYEKTIAFICGVKTFGVYRIR